MPESTKPALGGCPKRVLTCPVVGGRKVFVTHKTTRREFLKRSGVGVAGLSILPSKLVSAPANAGAQAESSLRPHTPLTIPGVHGYAEQSVAAGERIHFRISSSVPNRLGIHRLGLAPEAPDRDELLHESLGQAIGLTIANSL